MSLRRPILKDFPTRESHSGIPSFREGHVHFPPTPEISATYIAHSPRSYDRSPIVVSSNVCSMPKRHCPEKTYVLTEGKGEARLLKSEAKDTQQEDENEDSDATPRAEYHQGAVRMDYFSISRPTITWAESDTFDGLFSQPGEINSNRGHSQIPMFDVSVHDPHTRGTSESHEHVQAALSFLSHPPPPAAERKRNISLRDRERQDMAYTFSSGESGHSALLTRLRRPRRASSFTPDLPPDSGCLGGF